MKTIDIKFNELCDEIDHWKAEAKYYKTLYEEELKKYSEIQNERMEETKKGLANALMLALSISDNEDGSLTISKENREGLAKSYKS